MRPFDLQRDNSVESLSRVPPSCILSLYYHTIRFMFVIDMRVLLKILLRPIISFYILDPSFSRDPSIYKSDRVMFVFYVCVLFESYYRKWSMLMLFMGESTAMRLHKVK